MVDAYKWMESMVEGQKKHLAELKRQDLTPQALDHSLTTLLLLSSVNALSAKRIAANLLDLDPSNDADTTNLHNFIFFFNEEVERALDKTDGTKDTMQAAFDYLKQEMQGGYRWLKGEKVPMPDWLSGVDEDVYQMPLDDHIAPAPKMKQ